MNKSLAILGVCLILLSSLAVIRNVPIASAAQIFYDGWESGDHTAWNVTNGAAATVQSSVKYNGTYAMQVHINDSYGVGAYDSNTGLELAGYYIDFYLDAYIRFDNLTFGTDQTYVTVMREDGYNASDTSVAVIRLGSYYYFMLRYAWYNGTDVEWFDENVAITYPIQNATWYKVGLHWSMTNTTSKIATHQLYVDDVLFTNRTLVNDYDDQVSTVYMGTDSGNVTVGTYSLLAYYDDAVYGDTSNPSPPPSPPSYTEQIINGGFETGDSTNWSSVVGATTQYNHSGAYSLNIYSMGTVLWTNNVGGINSTKIFSMGFWYGNFAGGSGNDTIWYIEYSDGSNDTGEAVHVASWTYVDLLAVMNTSKLVTRLGIRGTTGNPSWVDDFSLIGEAPTPPAGTVNINVASLPELNAGFIYDGINTGTSPTTVSVTAGNHTFATSEEFKISGLSAYHMTNWLVNGTDVYGGGALTFDFQGDTNLTMIYSAGLAPVIPITRPQGSSSMTFYYRTDTMTTYGVYGFRAWENLDPYATAGNDTVVVTTSSNVSWGVRVWVLDYQNHTWELTSGTPVAIVTRTADGSGIQTGTWTTTADYQGVVDALSVSVYESFDNGSWALRLKSVTRVNLFQRLPAATWSFNYWTQRATGSTIASFLWGTSSYPSGFTIVYYNADVFDVMTYDLATLNFLGFLFAPWTYYLGSLFWLVVVLVLSGAAWLRYDSFQPVLAMWWIFGGGGGLLSLMLPQLGLGIAWLFLAAATAITLVRLSR